MTSNDIEDPADERKDEIDTRFAFILAALFYELGAHTTLDELNEHRTQYRKSGWAAVVRHALPDVTRDEVGAATKWLQPFQHAWSRVEQKITELAKKHNSEQAPHSPPTAQRELAKTPHQCGVISDITAPAGQVISDCYPKCHTVLEAPNDVDPIKALIEATIDMIQRHMPEENFAAVMVEFVSSWSEMMAKRQGQQFNRGDVPVARNCAVCGDAFIIEHARQKTCSDRCAGERRKANDRQMRIAYQAMKELNLVTPED